MRLRILGAAAGGGFPQWNCHCRACRGCREKTLQATPRTQSSLAVAAGDDQWVLINASPDVRSQLEGLPRPATAPVRWSPVAAVILTDSQLDHASGLLFLREAGAALEVHCTDEVYEDLTGPFPVLNILGSYCGITRHRLVPGDRPASLPTLGAVTVTTLPLGGKAPPYSPRRHQETAGTNVALALHDGATGRTALYAPALAAITEGLKPYLHAADLLLLDGTCWHDDDLARAGAGRKTARAMGHLPLAGSNGLLAALKDWPRARKILVHVNNTNPLLDEQAPERRILADHGVELARDGMEVLL